MNVSVLKMDSVNRFVKRIHAERDFILDIHTPSFDCVEGDVIKIQCSEKPIKNASYQMTGFVYHADNTSSCVSSGGLLAKIPKSLTENSRVYISISNSKVRAREATHETRKTRLRT